MAKNKYTQPTGETTSPETTTEVVEATQTQGEVTDQVDAPVDTDVNTGIDTDVAPEAQVDGGLTEGQDQDVEGNQEEPETKLEDQPEVLTDSVTNTDEEEANFPAEEEAVVELDVAAEVQRVIALINDSSLTPDSKLDQVAVSPFLAISIVGGRLKDYKEDMHRDNGQLELKQGASRNNQLYKTIMSVLKQEDEEIFKVGFNLINIIFKSFASEDEAFNHYSLTRYDAGWDNQKDLSTYNKLCVVITTLADAKTREELKTTIDFNKLRDRDKTNFTDKIVDRLVSYYGI